MTAAPPPVGASLTERARATGVFGWRGMFLCVLLFWTLIATNDSPVLGGGWAAYSTTFFVYDVMFLSAWSIEGVIAPANRAGTRVRLQLPEEDAPGALGNFAFYYGVFAVLALALGLGLLRLAHVSLAPALSGQAQINTLVWLVFFVSPTEEYFFRAVLSNRAGWFWGSVVAFAAFHVGAYTAIAGSFGVETLVELVVAGALGWVLWIVYDWRRADGRRRAGLGGSVPLHLVYDLLTTGTLTSVVAVGGLALVPLAVR